MTDRFPDAVLKQAYYAHNKAFTAARIGDCTSDQSLAAGYAAMRAVLEAHEHTRIARLEEALTAIYTSTREDEQGEQWTIRKYLDAHGVFNDNLSGSRRLVTEACKVALKEQP